MESIENKARKMAQRHYVSLAFRDQTTDGEPIYVALHPELNGCIAQGETMHEALENLNEMRVDYIQHLLEYNLPVPEPAWIDASHSKQVVSEQEIVLKVSRKLHLDEVIQPPLSDQPIFVTP